MPRKVPISNKRRKEQLLVKRALKRGDITADDHEAIRSQQKLKTEKRRPGQVSSRSGGTGDPSSRKLQSKFIALSADYVTRTRDLAFALPLERPLGPQSAEFPLEVIEGRDIEQRLSCPARPKFKYGQTKKEVERNEEGVFKKWLNVIEEVVEEWVDGEEEQVVVGEDVLSVPRGPTWFETNLEVWRQFWRVTEASHILLLLLDSRCPPLHCPPSLRTHLQSLKPNKEIILILTKSDLVDPKALLGWKEWVKDMWGQDGVHVVSVRSYDVALLRQRKGRHKPDIPQQSLDELISALRAAHHRLSEPPKWIKNDPAKLKDWKSPVRESVDWSALGSDDPEHVLTKKEEEADYERDEQLAESQNESREGAHYRDPSNEPLTLGLIGQPNVGKSSLLNALLGEQKVRASRTPGKTKHFQTMFWGAMKEIKIVDCPGLVCPSLAGLEIQTLAGIIPISQIPSLPSCILFASHHLPVEDIFRVPRPKINEEDSYVDKRTYRDSFAKERATQRAAEKRDEWTVGGVLEASAIDKGFMTAKGGRPDTNRAANGIMRALADGKVQWGFYPPGMTGNEGTGIWLGIDDPDTQALIDADGTKDHSESEEDQNYEDVEGEEETESEEEQEASAGAGVKKAGGFFAALELSDEDLEDASEDDKEEE